MRQASNNKIPVTKSKKWRKHRIRRAERVQREGRKTGFIEDAELITEHHLRKHRTSARANITLSGKKKRKLMKQLRHMQKDKNAMEVIEEVSSKNTKQDVKDTDMAEVADQSESSDTAEADQSQPDVEMNE